MIGVWFTFRPSVYVDSYNNVWLEYDVVGGDGERRIVLLYTPM